MYKLRKDHPDDYEGSSLDVALRNEQIDCAQVLLVNGAKIDQEFAVWHAGVEGKTRTLHFLMRNFPNCANNAMMNDRKDLLHVAVEKGHNQIVALLLDAGVDVNYVHNKKTPLMVAYHHEMIELLLNRGCVVNIKTDTTALINVLSDEYITKLKEKFHFMKPHENSNVNVFLYVQEIMSILLKYGSNINSSNDDGRTALMVGSEIEGTLGILKLLVDNGADINLRDTDGNAALHRAVHSGRTENVKLLLESGADVNLRDAIGSTPLHYAMESCGASESLNILLEHGADVNAQDNQGNTPLMILSNICFFSTENVIRTLVKAGSSVNQRNKSGMTVLMMFVHECDKDILHILLDSGADINAEVSDIVGKKTALSILLAEKNLPGRDDCLEAAEFMLDHGATARHVKPSIIHRAVANSHERFVQKLIQGGLAPQDIYLESNRIWPTGVVSPLSIALYTNNVRLARHFIGNWYLTKSDICNLSRNGSIIIWFMDLYKNSECLSLIQESQPLSLTLLSFIAVSTSIGVGHDRGKRIEATQLPWDLKDRLLFRNVRFDAEDGNKEHLKVIHYLAKRSPLNDYEMTNFVFTDSEVSEDDDDDSNAYSSDSD
ncbi:unnamed protein product [Lymnaea stagnalis]|uniref:Uncharacterized protein n=1 Tax=Lymnaea stagnalis TaxID=6523 RepID=A0AAV2HUP0_LYMST